MAVNIVVEDLVAVVLLCASAQEYLQVFWDDWVCAFDHVLDLRLPIEVCLEIFIGNCG